jgi:phosphate transport system protein
MTLIHLDRALSKLRVSLLELASLAEEQSQVAIEALASFDSDLAKKVRERDTELDEMEVDIEEACLQILALHQPVAKDLRFVVSVLKINNDLERIGDLAVNIAGRAITLSKAKLPIVPIDFSAAAKQAIEMIRMSIESFINLDLTLAERVRLSDRDINKFHRSNFKKINDAILNHPQHAENFIELLSVSRYLERIGDLTTNIAEDVIYLVNGSIVRHQPIETADSLQ